MGPFEGLSTDTAPRLYYNYKIACDQSKSPIAGKTPHKRNFNQNQNKNDFEGSPSKASSSSWASCTGELLSVETESDNSTTAIASSTELCFEPDLFLPSRRRPLDRLLKRKAGKLLEIGKIRFNTLNFSSHLGNDPPIGAYLQKPDSRMFRQPLFSLGQQQRGVMIFFLLLFTRPPLPRWQQVA